MHKLLKYNINMKKICSFLLICLFFNVSFISDNFVYSKTENTTYAKALSNCVLYKSQTLDNDINNIFFIVPETYFVVVLEKVDDLCLKVQYDKYIGYVNSESVLMATFIPIVKTLENITCDIKQTSGTQIWNKPSTEGNVLTTIPAGTTKISYIAEVYGIIPVGGVSNVWIYVTYTPLTNSTNVYEGYVYSENVTNVSEIVANVETNPEVIAKDEIVEKDETIYISSTFRTIITALISIPIILLFAIILYKFIKKFKKNTNNNKYQNNYYFDKTYDKHLNFDKQDNIYQENYFSRENNDVVLKDKIDKMKNTTYIKQPKRISKHGKSYPVFPVYNSEDDLLWKSTLFLFVVVVFNVFVN